VVGYAVSDAYTVYGFELGIILQPVGRVPVYGDTSVPSVISSRDVSSE